MKYRPMIEEFRQAIIEERKRGASDARIEMMLDYIETKTASVDAERTQGCREGDAPGVAEGAVMSEVSRSRNTRSYPVEFAIGGWLATTLLKQHRLAVPLLQRTEQTFSAMILICGG